MPGQSKPAIGQAATVVATGDVGRVIGLAEFERAYQPTVLVEFPRPGGNVRIGWYDPPDLDWQRGAA
jgi:hypothetical protein